MNIKENLELIDDNIRKSSKTSSQDPNRVTVIAVTKYVCIETTKEALSAGVKHLGENRVEGFIHKYNEIKDRAIWHFIGTLQSRKVKSIIDHVDYIHSLDRVTLAKEIQKRANRTIKCFVQVNVSGETSKQGMDPSNVPSFVEQVAEYDKVQIVGLMTMAPHIKDTGRLRNIFRRLKRLQQDIQVLNQPNAPCTELSMGMSNDYQIAVEEGATFVRIGTSLVGKEK